ncbi:MAG: methyl-accepting chemotaxis protein [bacterium]|nr:methyl-accepting chemotaxis protein [bacterium]
MTKKVGTKIFIMLSVMFLFAIIANGMNYRSGLQMLDKSKEVNEKYVVATRDMGTVSLSTERVQKYVNQLITDLSAEERTEITKKLAETQDSLTQSFNELGIVIEEVGEQNLIDTTANAKSAYTTYLLNAQKAIQLYTSGKKDEAEQIMNDQMVSLINTMDESTVTVRERLTELCNERIKDQEDIIQKQKVVAICLMLSTILALFVITGLTIKLVVNPIKHVTNELVTMVEDIDRGEGDLSRRIEIKSNDEIGLMAQGVNVFIQHLGMIIDKIKQESVSITASVATTDEQVNEFNSDVTDVSATLEELSASMEEITATIAEIGSRSDTILEATKDIAMRAGQGSDFATTIKEKSSSVHSMAEESRELTNTTVEQINAQLSVSLENSKNVSKINDLTSEILEIAGQTNLLALNASIEAARAGEAGHGFAVVAEEIRVLADNSRQTANNIQQISETVTDSVDELVENATKMIEFVKGKVLDDYLQFVETTADYNNDAEQFNQIMGEFKNHASELKETMGTVNEALSGIENTINESTTAVGNVAETTNNMVTSIGKIGDEMKNNKEIIAVLSEEVDKFKEI